MRTCSARNVETLAEILEIILLNSVRVVCCARVVDIVSNRGTFVFVLKFPDLWGGGDDYGFTTSYLVTQIFKVALNSSTAR